MCLFLQSNSHIFSHCMQRCSCAYFLHHFDRSHRGCRRTMRQELILLLSVYFLCSFAGAQTQYGYGCIIDAGSTSSRIYVYRWDSRAFPQLPPPVSAPIQVFDFVLNSVETRVDVPEGRAALPKLMDMARSKLAELGLSALDISAVPLFLQATAGMRVLSEDSRASAMAAVRSILSQGPFLYKPEWVRTISGEVEGVAGWIAVNYNAGTLPGQKPGSSTATIGALDLGGASTQITFVPPPGVDILSSQFDVRLSSVAQVSVYTHSFLYYGVNEAIRRINELVVLSSGLAAGATIPHPCYLTGTPGGVNFTSLVAGRQVNFSGSSNWSACKEFVAPLMLRGAQCLTDPKPTSWSRVAARSGVTAEDWAALQAQRRLGVQPLPVINPGSPGSSCSIAGQYQPPLVAPQSLGGDSLLRFKAFSGYSYLYDGLKLDYAAPLAELRTACATLCSLDFAYAKSAYPYDKFFNELCIRCVYAQTLLVEGYGLNATVPGLVTVVPSNRQVTWTLGSILYEANGLPFTLIAPRDQTPTVIALAVTLGVVVLGGAVFGVCIWRRWPKLTGAVNTQLL